MDELYHYGVKGMKWGVRKAQPPTVTTAPRQRSRDELYYQKKLNKQTQRGASARKIAKTQRNLDIATEVSRAREAYAKKTSKGKKAVASLLTGPLGQSSYYHRMRAAGYGKVKSYIASRYRHRGDDGRQHGEGWIGLERRVGYYEDRAAKKRLKKANK